MFIVPVIAVYTSLVTSNYFVQRSRALDMARSLSGDKGIINLGAGASRDSDAKFISETPEIEVNADINDPACVYVDLESPLSWDDDEFDVAFASHVLEHLHNWEQALDEWNRIADHVIVVVPHPLSIPGRLGHLHVQHFSFTDAKYIEQRWPKTKVFM